MRKSEVHIKAESNQWHKKSILWRLLWQTTGVIGLAMGLVGPVSGIMARCDSMFYLQLLVCLLLLLLLFVFVFVFVLVFCFVLFCFVFCVGACMQNSKSRSVYDVLVCWLGLNVPTTCRRSDLLFHSVISIVTRGRPVLALTLRRQSPDRVATEILVLKSLHGMTRPGKKVQGKSGN